MPDGLLVDPSAAPAAGSPPAAHLLAPALGEPPPDGGDDDVGGLGGGGGGWRREARAAGGEAGRRVLGAEGEVPVRDKPAGEGEVGEGADESGDGGRDSGTVGEEHAGDRRLQAAQGRRRRPPQVARPLPPPQASMSVFIFTFVVPSIYNDLNRNCIDINCSKSLF